MGVTFKGPSAKITIGYGTMFRMRADIAEIADKELGQHYEHLLSLRNQQEYDAYDRKTEEIAQRYAREHGRNAVKIFSFLYAPDERGKITYGCCKELLKVIAQNERFQETVYGYVGAGSETGADFIRLLEECVKNKNPLRWA